MILVLILVLAGLLTPVFIQGVPFIPQTDQEMLRNLLSTNSKLLLGTSHALYRLDLSLSMEERKELQSANRLLTSDIENGTLNGAIMSCDEDRCLLLDPYNLNNVTWDVPRSMVLLSGGGNVAGSFSIGPNGTSDITFAEPSGGGVPRRIVKGALRNVGSIHTDEFFRYASLDGDIIQETVVYLGTFIYSSYIYFTYFISSASEPIRVVRFCQKDHGIPSGLDRRFTTRYEVKLACGSMESRSIVSTAATYLPSSSVFSGPVIFLSVTPIAGDEKTNVCVFKLDDINQKMLEKLISCSNGVGSTGIVDCPTHFTQNQIQMQISEPCVLRSVLAGGLEVETPLAESALFTNMSNCEQYTSLLATSLDNVLFLFAGTVTGKLQQFYLSSPNQSVFIRAISFPAASPTNPSPSISKMLASDNGEYIYAMTENKLYRHTVEMCSTFTSCDSCTASRDPVCGWCSLRGQCSRQKDCSPANDRTGSPQTIWVLAGNNCPVIVNATPTVIYLPELTTITASSPSVLLVTANIDTVSELTNFDYQCRFVFNVPGSTPLSVAALTSGNMFSCRSPLEGQVPSLPSGRDNVEATLSIRVTQTDIDLVALAIPVGFTDCSIHNNCTGCITSGVDKCCWCPFSNKCIPDKQSFQCNSVVSSTELTIDHSNECPQIKPSPVTTQYLIHTNLRYMTPPLIITTNNLSMFRSQFDMGQFKCVICGDNSCAEPLFNVFAILESSGFRVVCIETLYSVDIEIGKLDVELRVVGNGDRRIDNPQQAKVTLYDCSNLGTNCGQCLSVPTRYNCNYCVSVGRAGQCRLESTCMYEGSNYSNVGQIGDCEKPTITSFQPKSGPTNGATEVTIVGTNLGSELAHLSKIMIDEIPCNITQYSPGVMIKCVTGRSGVGLVSDRVSVMLEYQNGSVMSQEDYIFKDPVLKSPPATPDMGPGSGGTNISISGVDLGIGSSHRVYVGTHECEVTRVQQNEIFCTTSMADSVGIERVVRVQVDNWSAEINGFTYLNDPHFESIEPRLFFADGGTNFTVKGERFVSVQNPRLLVYVGMSVGGRRRRHTANQERLTLTSEVCEHKDSTTLNCLAPPLNLSGGAMEVGFGLLMDNVTPLLELNGSLTVYPTPTFRNFSSEVVFSESDPIILTIQGDQFIFTSEQVRVRVSPCANGLGYCDCDMNNITNLNTLTCEVADTNSLTLDKSLQVTVILGYHSALVGTILVKKDLNILEILVPVFVAILILNVSICIVITISCLLQKRKHQLIEIEMSKRDGRVLQESRPLNSALFSEMNEYMEQFPDTLKIPSTNLTLESIPIGQGEFGIVYKALLTDWNSTGFQHVAVKTMKGLSSPADIQRVMNEVIKMQDFKHQCVMPLIGISLDTSVGIYIVMPYMANGSLVDFLKKERCTLQLDHDSDIDDILVVRKLLLKMCHEISLGMKYLAHQMFIHRDLAARNCMLDKYGSIKVGDFGLAEDMYSTGYFRQMEQENVKLPFKWMAPESLNDAIFTEKTDVWSYGVTIWEIFSGGRTPYPAVDPMSLIKLLHEGRRLERPDNAACATEIFSVMRKCWRKLPDDRPNFADLVSAMDHLLEPISGYTALSMNLPVDQGESGYKEIGPLENKSPENVNVTGDVWYGPSEDVNVTDNVAYGPSEGVNVTDHVAYGPSKDVNVTDNVAYGPSEDVNVADNVAYGPSEDVNVADNVAYGPSENVNVTDNVAYGPSDGVNLTEHVLSGPSEDVNVTLTDVVWPQ